MAFDVWDLDTMLGLLTDDFTVHHPKGVATGHDQMVAFYEAYLSAYGRRASPASKPRRHRQRRRHDHRAQSDLPIEAAPPRRHRVCARWPERGPAAVGGLGNSSLPPSNRRWARSRCSGSARPSAAWAAVASTPATGLSSPPRLCIMSFRLACVDQKQYPR
jgi:hypothetical protein